MATSYLSGVLEQVRTLPRKSLFTFSPPTAPQIPGYTMAVTLDAFDANGGARRLPLADAAAGSTLPTPLEVRATVVYTTPRGRLFSITSTTQNGT